MPTQQSLRVAALRLCVVCACLHSAVAWYSEWVPTSTLPESLHDVCSVACEGKVYVVGGSNDAAASPTALLSFGEELERNQSMYVLDPETMEWDTSVCLMPYDVSGPYTAVQADANTLLAFADASLLLPNEVRWNDTVAGNPPRVMQYDVHADRWTVIDSTPRSRVAGSAVAFDGVVYIVGGFPVASDGKTVSNAATNLVQIFDPVLRSWRTGPPMPKALARPAVTVQDDLYILGGMRGGEWQRDFYMRRLSVTDPADPLYFANLGDNAALRMQRLESEAWDVTNGYVTMPSTPYAGHTPMAHPTVTAIGSTLWVVGNYFSGTDLSRTMNAFLYDLYVGSWDTMSIGGLDKARQRFRGSTVTSTGNAKGNLFLIGGLALDAPHPDLHDADLLQASLFPSVSVSPPPLHQKGYYVGDTIHVGFTQVWPSNPYTVRISATPTCLAAAGGTKDCLWKGGNQVAFVPSAPIDTAYVCYSTGSCSVWGDSRVNCNVPSPLTHSKCAGAGCCFDSTKPSELQCYHAIPENTSAPDSLGYMSVLLWGASFKVSEVPTHAPATPAPTPAPTGPTPSPTPGPPTASPSQAPATPAPFAPTSPPSSNYSALSMDDLVLLLVAACVLLLICGSAYCILRGANRDRKDGGGGGGGGDLQKQQGIGGAPVSVAEGVAAVAGGCNSVSSAEDGISGGGAISANNKYVILKKLGSGGYGYVFLVKRRSDGMLLAMKYIQVENDEDRRDAISEFEAMRALKGHPNIIHVVDMFMSWSEEERPEGDNAVAPHLSDSDPLATSANLLNIDRRFVCIVMEYFPEGDLKNYLLGYGLPKVESGGSSGGKAKSLAVRYRHLRAQNRNPASVVIPEGTIWHIAHQVCCALVYMHSRRPPVMHRDLKPENILISNADELSSNGIPIPKCVVTDLGLAKGLSEKTYCHTQAGSLPYVAPECWQRHYSMKVDMWAVGCVLYAACANRADACRTRVMFSDVNKPTFVDDVTQEILAYGYTQDIVSFILCLLRVDPHHRYVACCFPSLSLSLSLSHTHCPPLAHTAPPPSNPKGTAARCASRSA